jgi:hypothetical protein
VLLAQDFKKNSETLEKVMENQNFWMCSRKCLMIFGGLGGAVFLIWLLYKLFS